jgi:hypothetical protein
MREPGGETASSRTRFDVVRGGKVSVVTAFVNAKTPRDLG